MDRTKCFQTVCPALRYSLIDSSPEVLLPWDRHFVYTCAFLMAECGLERL